MAERILVAVAWPYANNSIHLGHVAGTHLPADIFARYHRMRGNDVLMVSGSDAHGTPVTLTADERGVSPQQVYEEYQAEFLDDWARLGISYDLFTTTHTDNHFETAQDFFLKLRDGGYIYPQTMEQPYCETDRRFLADRYVEGKCPHCGFEGARGDQCDNCGRILDPKDLINIRCRICGNTPVFRDTEHFFLKLSAFEKQLLDWVRPQTHWRPNVRNFTLRYLEGGLHDRAITRDIEWGVPIPLEGYEGKRLYVWIEAVAGYLSASKEWAKRISQPERWRDFWEKDCRSYYFIGKDNIPFHTVIWPAMLMGYGGFNLPYDVPANEFLNLEGLKFSKSRNWAIWLKDYLDRFEPDPLRYVLTVNMPETSDSNFEWREYVRANNNELVGTYGNLVNRVLPLVARNFGGKVPQPGQLDDLSRGLLDSARARFQDTTDNLEACRFRAALQSAMALAQEANRYIDQKAPWTAIRTDREDAATTLWTCLSVINCLKVILYPFLPFSSERLHRLLGFDGSLRDVGWDWQPGALPVGQALATLEPLFVKLDEAVVEQELQRIS